MKILLHILIFVCLIFSTTLTVMAHSTWGVTIGSMCVEGIPESAVKIHDTEDLDGVEVHIFSINYSSEKQGGKALVRVFRETPKSQQPLAKCSELEGQLLFEGTAVKFNITKGRKTDAHIKPSVLRLDPHALDVELIRTKSNLTPLFGGQLQLGVDGAIAPSARTWITNSEMIVSTSGNVATGSVDVKSWGRLLKGLKVILPGDNVTTSLDMDAGNTNVLVRVPLSGGMTELLQGTFKAIKQELKSDRLTLPGVVLTKMVGRAGSIELIAENTDDTISDNKIRFSINNLDYDSNTVRLEGIHSAIDTIDANGTIKVIAASAPRSGSSLVLTEPVVIDATADGSGCSYAFMQNELARAMQCKTGVKKVADNLENYEFRAFNVEKLVGGSAISSTGEILFTSIATGNNEKFSGRIAEVTAELGALKLAGQTLLLDNPLSLTGGRVSFPFSFNLPSNQTHWSFKLPDGKVTTTGKLKKLLAKGVISTSPDRPSDWIIEIPKNDFAFAASVETVHEPYLYGSAPNYGKVTISITANTNLTIKSKESEGTLLAEASVFSLPNFKLALGKEENAMILNGPNLFDGAVQLTFSLKNGNTQITRGNLLLKNAKLVNQIGKPGDIGDILLHDAEINLNKLQVSFADNHGNIALEGFTIVASKIESKPRQANSGDDDQLAWAGKPISTTPMSIASITAKIAPKPETHSESAPPANGDPSPVSVTQSQAQEDVDSLKNALHLDQVQVHDLKVALKDVSLGKGRVLNFIGDELHINFSNINPNNYLGKILLTNAKLNSSETKDPDTFTNISADIDKLEIDITGITPKGAEGSATLIIKDISVDADSIFTIKTSCKERPDFGGIPINTQVKANNITMNLILQNGLLKGAGKSTDITLTQIKERSNYICNNNIIDKEIVSEVRAEYDYPCPTIAKPFRLCRGWTVLVPAVRVDIDSVLEFHHLRLAGFFTELTLKLKEGDDKVVVCGKKGMPVPLVDYSFTLKPHTGLPVLDDVWEQISKSVTRPILSSITSELFATYGLFKTFDGVGICTGG
jgi:hypothetical protein